MIRRTATLLKSCNVNSTPLRTSYLTIAASCVLPASDSTMLLVFSGFRIIFAELCYITEPPLVFVSLAFMNFVVVV
jgi:hypothetical protein